MDSSGPRIARLLASLLSGGTWVASLVIAAGLLTSWAGQAGVGSAMTTAGILLVVLLPVIRVVTVLAHFSAAGERKFMAWCIAVLAIIVVSVVAGLMSPELAPGTAQESLRAP
jgi:hypothetical protein